MSGNFVQSATLRRVALGAYLLYARSQVWRTGPRVFVNSIPKAGTHLLTAELAKFAELQNSRMHVDLPGIALHDGRTPGDAPLYDVDKLTRQVGTVRGGQFFSAHLPWSDELAGFIAEANLRTIFMTRDPRAVLVSRLHYILGLRRHRLHTFLTDGFATEVARYHALIDGQAIEPRVMSLADLLAGFVPWTAAPGVLTVRFEDLVGERGGGSAATKKETLAGIARHCGLPADRLDAIATTATGATPTLRKGQANAWRDELPPEIARRITDEFGRSLEALGYPAE